MALRHLGHVGRGLIPGVLLMLLLAAALFAGRTEVASGSSLEARQAAAQALGGSGDCFVMAAVLLAPAAVGAAEGTKDGWVVPGEIFRGEVAAAADAFGGRLVATGGQEAWIVRPGGQRAVQLREFAPGLWRLGDSLRRCGPGEEAR